MTDPVGTPIADATIALQKAAQEFGVRGDHPEGVFLKGLSDMLVAFDRRLDVAGRGSEDAIKGVVRRTAATAMSDAAKAFQRAQTWRSAAIVAGVAIVALGMGFAVGYTARGAAQDGAAAQLSELAAQCAATSFQQNGGKACTIRLWVDEPTLAGR